MGAILNPLHTVKAGPVSAHWGNLYSAQNSLEGFFANDWFWPAIKNSYDPGQRLLTAIKAVTAKNVTTDQINFIEAFQITHNLSEFDTVLKAELSNSDAYFVSGKGGYDTSTLIGNAEAIFSTGLAVLVPNAIPDIRESGKCLAYELGTAAGFHALRATEAVVRRYWEIVTQNKPHPKQRNLGNYLTKMEEFNVGDSKVISALRQIKDLHRNPLAHPEEYLTLDQAINLLGISRSAIGYMLPTIEEAAAATIALPAEEPAQDV